MEPEAVWAGPGYFIQATSLLGAVALYWRRREHDAEWPLFCSVFPGEQSGKQNGVVAWCGQSSWRICPLLFLSQAWVLQRGLL